MLKRLGMVFLFACFLALGIALSRAAPAPMPDANGNPAPARATWPDKLTDPAGEWAAFFDVYDNGAAVAHIRWPHRAFPSYRECIQMIGGDAGFAVDFQAVMRVAKESFGASTPVGIHCAPYGESK